MLLKNTILPTMKHFWATLRNGPENVPKTELVIYINYFIKKSLLEYIISFP